MGALVRRPAIWMAALLAWAAVLWTLSSLPKMGPTVKVDHLDKLLHFGYFLGGGFLSAGWAALRYPQSPPWKPIIAATIAALAVVGAIDEWHQLHTPGRSGGDPWDWLADTSGAAVGALLLKRTHRRLTRNPLLVGSVNRVN